MEKLVQNNAVLVLDVLAGRLAFERTGVKLYDSVVRKIERLGEPRYHRILDALRKYRGEEAEHVEFLESTIRGIGGNPNETTDMAQLEDTLSGGVKSVILDGDTRVPHLLQALLTAELADNAGWDLLVAMADETGDHKAKRAFAKRLAQELRHLAYLREVMKRTVQVEILGQDEELPTSAAGAVSGAIKQPLRTIAAIVLGTFGAAAAATAAAAFGTKRTRRRLAGEARRIARSTLSARTRRKIAHQLRA